MACGPWAPSRTFQVSPARQVSGCSPQEHQTLTLFHLNLAAASVYTSYSFHEPLYTLLHFCCSASRPRPYTFTPVLLASHTIVCYFLRSGTSGFIFLVATLTIVSGSTDGTGSRTKPTTSYTRASYHCLRLRLVRCSQSQISRYCCSGRDVCCTSPSTPPSCTPTTNTRQCHRRSSDQSHRRPSCLTKMHSRACRQTLLSHCNKSTTVRTI